MNYSPERQLQILTDRLRWVAIGEIKPQEKECPLELLWTIERRILDFNQQNMKQEILRKNGERRMVELMLKQATCVEESRRKYQAMTRSEKWKYTRNLNQTQPPAPTTSSADVQRAADDARLQSGRRKGLRQTILTGDTGSNSKNLSLRQSVTPLQ